MRGGNFYATCSFDKHVTSASSGEHAFPDDINYVSNFFIAAVKSNNNALLADFKGLFSKNREYFLLTP